MKKIFIKYNPYSIQTEITIDGKPLALNSKIREKSESPARLQEWVEDFPQDLIDQCNDTDFDVSFHGTLLDYEDLTEAFQAAFDRHELTAKLDRIPAKETSDKEKLIDDVFEKIQKGPIDELKTQDIISAFEHVKSSDFEVCVVATMSAGKSTLINSMLGAKLMPSKQEACTAIITRIKDNDDDEKRWQAEVYDKSDRRIGVYPELTYETMTQLNDDSRVSVIKVNGDIPFVMADDVSLVLIDTPGPNNARDPEHRKVQSSFLNRSSKSLVLYIMEGTFGSDDDNALLQRVADSMKVGGKQSKDRFLFVINKMDDRRKEDGDTGQTLQRVRDYLKRHGIINPNLFPAAALPALNIRLMQSGVEVDEDTEDETEMKVRKLNRRKDMHFEQYASLPSSIKKEIDAQVAHAEETDDTEMEALVHTGVPSLEAAIRQYVQKYAKTAKVKNIVDTFIHKLEEIDCLEKTKHELAANREASEQFIKQIESINKNIADGRAAQQFTKELDDTVKKVGIEAADRIDEIVQKYQVKITKQIDDARGQELDVDEAKIKEAELFSFAQKLEPDFQAELDELIHINLIQTGNALLDKYKKRLASLTQDLGYNSPSGITIDPLKLMGSSVVQADDSLIDKLTQSKQVEDGKEWVRNTDKKWYKPWTWFQESGYYRKKYKTVKYVAANELAQQILAPVQDGVYENGDKAKAYAQKQSNQIARLFKQEFLRLDEVLKRKLAELESYATEQEKAEERVHKSEQKLQWLESIKAEVESILEI